MTFSRIKTAFDFERAYGEAFWEGWRKFFLRRPNKLLSFSAVEKLLDLRPAQEIGMQEIKIDDIIGSDPLPCY